MKTLPQAVARVRVSGFGLAVAAVLGLALAIRLAFVLQTPDYLLPPNLDPRLRDDYAIAIAHRERPPGVPYDPWDYDQIAMSLAREHGYRGHLPPVNASRPPGYPFFLSSVYELIGFPARVDPANLADRVLAARLVEALLSVLTVGLIGLIAFQLWHRRIALAAMALAAAYLPLVLVGTAYLSEALFVPLLLGAVAAAIAQRSSPRRLGWVVAAGVLAGLGALVRGNGVVLVAPLAVMVWDRRPRLSAGALAAPATLIAAATVTIAPWTIRNAVELNRFVPVAAQDGFTLAGTYNDASRNAPIPRRGGWVSPPRLPLYQPYLHRWARREISGLELQDAMRAQALRYARDHPYYTLEVGFWNTVRLLEFGGRYRSKLTARTSGFGPEVADAAVYCFWVVAALALVGGLTPLVRRVPRSLWLVPVVLALSVVFVQSATPRFRAPLDPFLILLAAPALTAALSLRRREASPAGRGRRTLSALAR